MSSNKFIKSFACYSVDSVGCSSFSLLEPFAPKSKSKSGSFLSSYLGASSNAKSSNWLLGTLHLDAYFSKFRSRSSFASEFLWLGEPVFCFSFSSFCGSELSFYS